MKMKNRLLALVIGIGLPLLVYAGLESVTHIQDLNASWPLGSDLASTSDDHIRNIKSALKTDFPNFNGTYSSASAPVFAIPNDTNTGMYGPSADTLGWATGGTQRGTVNSTGNWTLNAPSTGIGFTVNGVANQNSQLIQANSTSSQSFGLQVNGGTNSSDWSVNFANASGISMMKIGGAGNVAISAPSSGTALDVTAFASQYASRFHAGTASNNSFGVAIFGGTSSADIGFVVDNGAGTADYFRVRGDGQIAGNGPVAGALVDMTPDTGTFTATYTGFTATVACTAAWSRIGKIAVLQFCNATGTSNSISFTMTGLPSAIQPATLCAQTVNVAGLENNGGINGIGTAQIGCSGTVTFHQSEASQNWTSSGTKGISTPSTVTYLLN